MLINKIYKFSSYEECINKLDFILGNLNPHFYLKEEFEISGTLVVIRKEVLELKRLILLNIEYIKK